MSSYTVTRTPIFGSKLFYGAAHDAKSQKNAKEEISYSDLRDRLFRAMKKTFHGHKVIGLIDEPQATGEGVHPDADLKEKLKLKGDVDVTVLTADASGDQSKTEKKTLNMYLHRLGPNRLVSAAVPVLADIELAIGAIELDDATIRRVQFNQEKLDIEWWEAQLTAACVALAHTVIKNCSSLVFMVRELDRAYYGRTATGIYESMNFIVSTKFSPSGGLSVDEYITGKENVFDQDLADVDPKMWLHVGIIAGLSSSFDEVKKSMLRRKKGGLNVENIRSECREQQSFDKSFGGRHDGTAMLIEQGNATSNLLAASNARLRTLETSSVATAQAFSAFVGQVTEGKFGTPSTNLGKQKLKAAAAKASEAAKRATAAVGGGKKGAGKKGVRKVRKCFNCGKTEHLARDCPEPKKKGNGKGKR